MPEGADRAEVTREVDWSAFESLWRPGDELASPPRLRAVSTVIALVLWAVSLVLLGVTWNEVAERNNVADQVPWLVSGGLVAIVLAIIGGAVYLGGGPPIGRRPPPPPAGDG
ncbi:MAG TPA: hypothetical protein VM262_11705 [Acidimicrobiales bacterium]|nr:hypothetical protein [Acidimicrobiales bacterium]